MILKFTKCLNTKKEFTLISFDMTDKKIDEVGEDKFDNNVFEDDINYYYYIKDIIDIGECEKFKIKVKKGDIVSLTARDNSYMVFPSKKSFSYAFNLKYNEVLDYKYKEVLYDGKPYEVKYVKDNNLKVNDGVVFTLSQLCSYISVLLKAYNLRKTITIIDKPEGPLKRVINKHYSTFKSEISNAYELNIKKVFVNGDRYCSKTYINVSRSNKYLYDYYLIRMFAYMIFTKSQRDRETNNDPLYSFNVNFDTLEDVYKYLEDNQDIVNNFFIETELLFTRPNEMFTAYCPHLNGVYMFYEYKGVKTYLYRNVDKKYFDEKSLKLTYVSTKYKHKIKGIKNNFSNTNIFFMNNED